MKGWSMLVWLTQLGLSAALPALCFTLLGVWLHRCRSWGTWTIWAGLVLGLVCAVRNFLDSLKAMERTAGTGKQEPPLASFNDHK